MHVVCNFLKFSQPRPAKRAPKEQQLQLETSRPEPVFSYHKRPWHQCCSFLSPGQMDGIQGFPFPKMNWDCYIQLVSQDSVPWMQCLLAASSKGKEVQYIKTTPGVENQNQPQAWLWSLPKQLLLLSLYKCYLFTYLCTCLFIYLFILPAFVIAACNGSNSQNFHFDQPNLLSSPFSCLWSQDTLIRVLFSQ